MFDEMLFMASRGPCPYFADTLHSLQNFYKNRLTNPTTYPRDPIRTGPQQK